MIVLSAKKNNIIINNRCNGLLKLKLLNVYGGEFKKWLRSLIDELIRFQFAVYYLTPTQLAACLCCNTIRDDNINI